MTRSGRGVGIADDGTERYVVISADCHAGASVEGYKPYLEEKWHADFDEWAKAFHDPWVEMADAVAVSAERRSGVASGQLVVNWDTARRQHDLDADGIAAEVVYPNTAPPFYPSGVLTAPAPRNRDEYEHRIAGLRAHNRWLVDFCEELPGRRAGVAQVMLNDIDDAVAEVRWARNAGLTGGIIIPVVEPGSDLPPLYSDAYEPLWRVCEELEVPVNEHANSPSFANDGPVAAMLGIVEGFFWSNRAVWHMILSGVFERYPRLRFVLSEQSIDWVPSRLEQLDSICKAAGVPGTPYHARGGAAAEKLSLTPSEYFARNCYLGASFLPPLQVPRIDEIGIDRIMWGSDYPHSEGTFPYTTQALQASFADRSRDDVENLVALTAAAVYDFDLAQLEGVAASIGPRVDQVSQPLQDGPKFPEETVCTVFASDDYVLVGR